MLRGAKQGGVLGVDDEPTIGEMVVRYLERAGYRTRLATDGQAPLAAVAADPPDLIVLDGETSSRHTRGCR